MYGRKVKSVFLWSGIVLIILTGVAYWGINAVMNKMLYAIAPNVKPSLEERAIPNQNTPAPATSAITPVPEVKQNESSLDVNLPAASTTASTAEPVTNKESQSPSVSTAPVTPTSAAPSYVGSISANKAKKAEEQITLEDKALLTSIFLKRFSPQELSAFMSLASGGLSIKEKVEAKKLVLNKLSEDEYNKLISIAAKLDLSQGKSYKDSLKEMFTPKP